MITEKYCNEILQQYPEYITKDQMYRICHISKKTCLFLLESGLVPNIDSGKKTRRFKIKTVDVIQYLKDRDDYPELFKAPDGFYKGKGGDKKAPSFDEVFTHEDLIRIQKAEQGIRFIDPNYKELFRIPDGGKIIITSSWGEKTERPCRFIDEYHTEIGNNIFHICEFAERMEQNGATYEPKPTEPQTVTKAPKHKDLER